MFMSFFLWLTVLLFFIYTYLKTFTVSVILSSAAFQGQVGQASKLVFRF